MVSIRFPMKSLALSHRCAGLLNWARSIPKRISSNRAVGICMSATNDASNARLEAPD